MQKHGLKKYKQMPSALYLRRLKTISVHMHLIDKAHLNALCLSTSLLRILIFLLFHS